MRVIGLSIAIVLACVACGDDGAGTADAANDASAVDAVECARVWSVNLRHAGSSATVANGALTLSDTNTEPGSALEVEQAGVTGDFDLAFSFAGWTAAGTGAFFQAGIGSDVPVQTRFVVGGIGTFPIVGVGVAEQPDTGDPAAQLAATTAVAGSVRYRRTGSTLTATATTSDATAEIVLTDFSEDPLKVGVQLGSNMGTVAGVTTVDVTEFTISGGGTTVTDDSFDCDSLIAP
jgi:hypothetical protein